MRPYASPRPLAWLSAAVLLSAALLPPVIRDAPGADPTSPEGGSNSVTEKPAAKKLLPENRKLVAREPPAEIALSKKPLVRLAPAKKKSAAERTVAKTEYGGGRPACRPFGPKTTPCKQGEADDQPEARTTASRP